MKDCDGAWPTWAEQTSTGLTHGDPVLGNTAYGPGRVASLSTQSAHPHDGIRPKLGTKILVSKRRNLHAPNEDLT